MADGEVVETNPQKEGSPAVDLQVIRMAPPKRSRHGRVVQNGRLSTSSSPILVPSPSTVAPGSPRPKRQRRLPSSLTNGSVSNLPKRRKSQDATTKLSTSSAKNTLQEVVVIDDSPSKPKPAPTPAPAICIDDRRTTPPSSTVDLDAEVAKRLQEEEEIAAGRHTSKTATHLTTEQEERDAALARQLQEEEQLNSAPAFPANQWQPPTPTAGPFAPPAPLWTMDMGIAYPFDPFHNHPMNVPSWEMGSFGLGRGGRGGRGRGRVSRGRGRGARWAQDMLQLASDRDFNANDYEMLLQLDERLEKKTGASPAEISALPTRKLMKEKGEEEVQCVVCLDTITPREKVRELPCKHIFHMKCIDKWLKVNRACPIDKVEITKNSRK